MKLPWLTLLGLWSLCFTLATQLGAWREQSAHTRTDSGGFLQSIIGDSQRLFANHFVTKADVYLHSGVYPSIFDQAQKVPSTVTSTNPPPTEVSPPEEREHGDHSDHEPAGATHTENEHDHDRAVGFLGPPRDWIDAFGRNFFPTKHTHLDENGNQREVLPWLKLAAELNPHDVNTFTLGAYWLRRRMGLVNEAEAFLREGWRANPNSYEILFELGRLLEESRNDFTHARNLLVAALKNWHASEDGKEHPDEFTLMEITTHLALVEEKDGQTEQAIRYLEQLRKLSPNPEAVQAQIDLLHRRGTESVHGAKPIAH